MGGMKDQYDAGMLGGNEEEAPMDDMGADSSDEPSDSPAEESDEFTTEAHAAFDTGLPMSERVSALKSAIMACMGTDYGGESKEKKASPLALIFGGKK